MGNIKLVRRPFYMKVIAWAERFKAWFDKI